MDKEQSHELPEVYKVVGAPGTGKTTRVVGNKEIDNHTSLVQENMDEYDIDDQLIVTYTKAATEEAADRLYDITDFTKKLISTRVTTIHSQCYSILNNTQHFDGMDREQVVQHWNKRNFCKAYDLDFGYDDDEDDIMGNDKQDGNALFDIYNWLQSNLKPMEEWEDCPADKPDIGDIQWHLEAWEEWKDERDLVGFGDMIEEVLKLGRQQLINLGYGMVFPDDSVGYIELFKKARDDPDRDPQVLRGMGAFVDTRVMYVDEVQDLNPLQWAWYLLQKLVCEKVYIGGDDDQCLPPNAPVEVKNNPMFNPSDGDKEFQKPIKDVQVGDLVRTLKSDGEYGYRRVSNVKKKEVEEKTFRTITTESGNKTQVTANHKMLSRIPSAEYEREVNKHYVYLMRDNNGKWRIGETDNLRQRLNVERGARCIVPLDSFDTKEKALEKETEWSLTYSIPQLTIQQRDGEVLSDPEVRDRIYDSVNPQYGIIERDMGVDLAHPPLYKKATTRGQTSSINISIKKCADMRGKKPRHSLGVHTSNESAIEKLRTVDGITEGESGGKSTRFRTTSTDYTEIGSIAEEVRDKVGGDIVTNMSPTKARSGATISPAGNLVEGMLVPVTRDNTVVWEEVVDIEDVVATSEVYDLTVPGTHTFTTAGIGVSNTIYGWGGADPEFMLGEEGDFEVLDKTYRIPKNVWEVCDTTIRQVDNRQEKDVTPHGDGGEVECLRAPSPRQVAQHLDGDSNFVLFRARYMIDKFTEDLRELGIPYRNMSTFDTWDGDMTTIRDALAKMEITGEKLTKDETSALTDNIAEERVAKGGGSKSTSSILGGITGKKPEDVKEMFNFPGAAVHRGRFIESWLEYAEELNYYEKEALRGNILNNNHEMDPERIRLGTIHSAKGREAENVIVALDSTSTIVEGMRDDTKHKPGKVISDAERRVYYVAMSRASEKLVLAEGVVNPDTTLEVSNLVGDEYSPAPNGPGENAQLHGW